jgi:opacity protein-like surface antigen
MHKFATGCLLTFSLVLVLSAARVQAQGDAGTTNGFSLDDKFKFGSCEVSLGVAPMFSPIGNDYNRPVVNWVEGYAQFGYMVTDIHLGGFLDGFFRGNIEAVGEAFGGGIYEETGNYVAGGSIMARYNFIQSSWRLAPYIQTGVGGEMMDINHQYDGHNFNFNVVAMGGLRYFIKPNVSLNAEFRFQHLSNANTGDHNIGINAVGPGLGISWFF